MLIIANAITTKRIELALRWLQQLDTLPYTSSSRLGLFLDAAPYDNTIFPQAYFNILSYK
jgi:hypothetical protein